MAIAGGMVAGAVVQGFFSADLRFWALLALCAAPAFLWGLIEDVSRRGAILVRLALTGTSAGLAFILLDARITVLDVPGLDHLLTFHAFSFAFTVLAVTGVANAMNVIDGLNGLCGVTALLAAAGLALVAWTVGDPVVFAAASVLAASVAGFLSVNFPRGRIFLGDGGAYLMGLLLALLSVMLVHRNSEVSPWFPLILLAYPIWETLFSMYRRRMRGHSIGRADALHLHSLVYRRVVRWRGFAGLPRDYVARNSLASLCLWPIPALCLAIALAFWRDSAALQIAAACFGIGYTLAYRRLVRFGVPAWLVIRARGTREIGAEPAEVWAGRKISLPGTRGMDENR
ncbi:MAG: MraY family glycosyltransferase [Burkholderiales bacterium]